MEYRWNLAVNYDKSKVMHFRKKRTLQSEVPFHIGNTRLDYCKEYKYLGVYFNEYLDYNSTSEHFVSSAERALGSIVAKYKKFPEMGYSTFTKLYDN